MSRTNTYLRKLPPGLTHIDVYWVLRLFNVTDPCAQHAVKKLLADGSGDKDRAENMREAWETLDRWREMEREQELRGRQAFDLDEFDRQWSARAQASGALAIPDVRQEQVRERHDVVPEAVRSSATMVTGRCPGNGNRDVCVHECRESCAVNGLAIGPGEGWQELRPPDRPLASHCPDGGACRHKCGLEPCKGASE